MAHKKKLQVFVSSTYSDLRAERQAAVEAILTAGHIPAGMELFAAGDQSQMTAIHRWIDESDVFLLILGGRYGSLEPTSGKSYTHLEYDYAIETKKAFFAVVIDAAHVDERARAFGPAAPEHEHEHEQAEKLSRFRGQVLTKLVRFWRDPRDIKLAIHETMAEYASRTELCGWVEGDQVVDGALLAEQIARLTRENADLRMRLDSAEKAGSTDFVGLNYEQMSSLLHSDLIEIEPGEERTQIEATAIEFDGSPPSLLHVFWHFRDSYHRDSNLGAYMHLGLFRLASLGLLEISGGSCNLTDDGRKFLLRLRLDRARRTSSEPSKVTVR